MGGHLMILSQVIGDEIRPFLQDLTSGAGRG